MNTKARLVLILALALLAGAALVAVTWAAPGSGPLRLAQGRHLRLARGEAPTVVAYQGEVRVSGTPFTGNGHFKFAVVNAAGDAVFWSNDGTSTGGGEPTAAVQLAVSDGLFSVLLGDTTLGGMTQALTADVFGQSDRYLRVWFGTSAGGPFSQLAPDTRIAAVPYALQAQEAVDADTVDGLHASELKGNYQNVVVVAKSGGHYTSVQAAIDSVAGATAGNPYLVWVAPGVYEEQVTMKPHVHLQGAGQEVTVITSAASNSAWPPGATLVLASETSVRDLTVGNSGTGDNSVALLATAGMTRTLVADVMARAQESGMHNYGIVLTGNGTGVTLQQVTALGENGGGTNYGLFNEAGAVATLRGGSFTGRGGAEAYGITNTGSVTRLEAESVAALAENGSNTSYGLLNVYGAGATLLGGSFTARGGDDTRGIISADSNTRLVAKGVTVLAKNGSGSNYGLENRNGSEATLRGGSITGRGGTNAFGIYNVFNGPYGATLEATSITVRGENGSNDNFGLVNLATATVDGGSITGRGGLNGWGILNSGDSAELEAGNVTVLAENGSRRSYGLENRNGATATLRGGSVTGRGGINGWGIYNDDSDTTLVAENITALGENGTNFSYGLYNHLAEATVRGGSFTGRGGQSADGIIHNEGTLVAESVTAVGENGNATYGLDSFGAGTTANVTRSVLEGTNWSVHQSSGSVTVSNSRLVDGGASAAVTCVLVTRGTGPGSVSTDGSSCP